MSERYTDLREALARCLDLLYAGGEANEREALAAVGTIADIYRALQAQPARRRRGEAGPVIHFARSPGAGDRVEMGPALCGAGAAGPHAAERYVIGVWAGVDCQRCHAMLAATNRAEAREAAGLERREYGARIADAVYGPCPECERSNGPGYRGPCDH